MFGPQQIATNRIADGGEGQRSGHRAEKELNTAKRVGQTGSREIPVDLALAQ